MRRITWLLAQPYGSLKESDEWSMPYKENLEDEGSKIKKLEFMTSKWGALQAAESTTISTKEQIVDVGKNSLVERELGQVPG